MSKATEQYFEARNQADAYAQNGDIANALVHYDKALELVKTVGFSAQQQDQLTKLVTRRRNRVANGEKVI